MREKEKMEAGLWHLPGDEVLRKERSKAERLLFEYNGCHPDDKEVKEKLLDALLRSHGRGTNIKTPFKCDYGSNIHIGDWFFANANCTILDSAKVIIGDEVQFGPNVSLYTVSHPLDFESRKQSYERALPIIIEEGVWLGGNVVVLGGVTIGARSVIGAGSVVTKDIPADSLAVGNPCQVIRKIDQNEHIKREE